MQQPHTSVEPGDVMPVEDCVVVVLNRDERTWYAYKERPILWISVEQHKGSREVVYDGYAVTKEGVVRMKAFKKC